MWHPESFDNVPHSSVNFFIRKFLLSAFSRVASVSKNIFCVSVRQGYRLHYGYKLGSLLFTGLNDSVKQV